MGERQADVRSRMNGENSAALEHMRKREPRWAGKVYRHLMVDSRMTGILLLCFPERS